MEEVKKRKRKRKRTKTEEAHRIQLLDKILDKWVCVKFFGEDDDNYVFMKHRIAEGGTHSKIEQTVLSDDPLQDGVYAINDYEIDMIYDNRTNQEYVELRPKKFDLKIGLYSEDEMVKNLNELKNRLISGKYLTESEFELYCQKTNKPDNVQEIKLAYDSIADDKE